MAIVLLICVFQKEYVFQGFVEYFGYLERKNSRWDIFISLHSIYGLPAHGNQFGKLLLSEVVYGSFYFYIIFHFVWSI